LNVWSNAIREWAGCAIAIALVVAAAAYTLMRGSRVGSDIQSLRSAADTLNSSAIQAPASVVDASLIERLAAQRDELEARLRDSTKQGLVVTQLSEEARRSGLRVVEIQPRRAPGAWGSSQFPLYRVSVEGTFEAIATYMDGCRGQRIPARVVEFGVVPTESDGIRDTASLRADITVEAFTAHGSFDGGRTNG